VDNYVAGSIPVTQSMKDGHHLSARLESLGYHVNADHGNISIRKPAQIESVLHELVPLCQEVQVDPQALFLVEINDGKPNAYYQEGKFHR
jgi:hypothetical protein